MSVRTGQHQVELGSSLIICTSNYGTEEEIRKSLGDALYSRFDSLIKFESLSIEKLLVVLDRLVDKRIELLTLEERRWLDRDEVLAILRPAVSKVGNVRKLGKLVDDLVSRTLVTAMLDDSSQVDEIELDEESSNESEVARKSSGVLNGR